MRLALDTNAYTALMAGHREVAARIRQSERVFVSAVVVGELLFGFRHGSRLEDNLRQLDRFLESPYVELLPVTRVTADRFGRIAAALRRRGRPIPSNDVWIAAQTMEVGAELLSADAHFDAVEGLVWTRFE